ncbi:MAG: NADH-quinone oxidoreductase subunit NuoE [Pseudomonadales bacterium]|nr:NADH-quinone oxidoreductase subunit NuoE [Pseudomonadales bacterium]
MSEVVSSNNVIASNVTRARKLTDAEIAEIEHEMTLYPDKQAVGLEALKIVQKHQGWVSDESLLAISRYLDIPAADLEGVATFFNLVYRQPVGKRVILFCRSVSCWITGCEEIRSKIKQSLGIDYGETTADNEYTFIPVPCLGDCDNGPVMMVGDDLHRRLTPQKIDEIIAEYKDKGEA